MSNKTSFAVILVTAIFVLWGMTSGSDVSAQETLRYSRSAQVYEAFGKAVDHDFRFAD